MQRVLSLTYLLSKTRLEISQKIRSLIFLQIYKALDEAEKREDGEEDETQHESPLSAAEATLELEQLRESSAFQIDELKEEISRVPIFCEFHFVIFILGCQATK